MSDPDDPTEPPNGEAIFWGSVVWDELDAVNLHPHRIIASTEGGIAFCFIKGNQYSDIECLNTGEILGVTSNRKDRPVVWQIKPDAFDIAQAAVRVREFLDS